MRHMTDRDIVERFFRRDDGAIEETRRAYQPYCMAIARHLTGSDEEAEECVSDALCAAWNSIPPQRPENLKTYVGKLTRRAAISLLRRKSAARRVPEALQTSFDELAEVAPDDSFSEAVDRRELSRAISRFLRELPGEQRNIFVRRYWYGDSVREICARYGLGESKVKSALKRTRDKLADFLGKEGFTV